MKILSVLIVICIFVLCIGAVLSYIDHETEQCKIAAQKLGLQYDYIQLKCYVRTDSMEYWVSLTYYQRTLFESQFMNSGDE